ncbi:hypothetical protein PAENIP36_49690 [Paenibacillus sp. P36]
MVEGIEAHEIVYLKKSSLDTKKQLLTVTDAFGAKRQVHVSKRCVDLFQKAMLQTQYVAHLGHPTKQKVTDLRSSDDLIKVSMDDFIANRCLITQMDCVLLRTIYMRLRQLAERFATPELTYLTTTRLEIKQAAHA